MGLGQSDKPVQALPPNGPDHSLADRIRRWTARQCRQHAEPGMADGLVRGEREYAVAVVDQILVTVLIPDRFSQLLAGPARARMGLHVAVNQPSAPMLDDNEYVEQPECIGHTATKKPHATTARA